MADDLEHENHIQADAEDFHAVETAEEPKLSAEQRLRAFEDDKLGPDAVRINGQIERGYGSKFRDLSEEDRNQHGKLEKLVEVEQKLTDARAALAVAENAYADAEAAVNDA